MEIELSNTSQKVIIDDEDFDLVKGYSWFVVSKRYAGTSFSEDGKKGIILMHRLIIGAKKGQIVDHQNRNGFDNRKINIRLCTHSQNMANRKMSKNNRTGVRGVYKQIYKSTVMYRADLRKDGVRYRKNFSSLEEAAKWVKETSLTLHKDFCCLDGL